MGLDMYANSVKKGIELEGDFGFSLEGTDNTEIKYWRKFNNLHGWMEELYVSKGGVDEFNCVYLKLTLEDLERLKLEASGLKPTTGFFFGSQNEMEPEDVEDVVSFCDKAIKEIEEGNTVVYYSWW